MFVDASGFIFDGEFIVTGIFIVARGFIVLLELIAAG
jgi:hypothetical protein